MSQTELPLRIVVQAPPPGVSWAVQRGRDGLLAPTGRDGDALVFEFTVRVRTQPDGTPNFLGDYAHGTPADRFVYVNSGISAGQHASPWTRRAKVKLATITREMVDEALDQPGTVLEARFHGVDKKGGPACATVPLLGGGWKLVSTS